MSRYDPTQYERQHRKTTRPHTPDQCPECGDSHHLVIANGGLECWACDEFIPSGSGTSLGYISESEVED